MPRAAFFTLGCKVNQYESFSLMRDFTDAGFEIVEADSAAEVYIVNSCTVTSTGDRKSLQVLRRLRRQAPGAVIALCGCFPQAFPEQAAAVPEADIVMGSKNRAGLLSAVQKMLSGKAERLIDIAPHIPGEPFEPMRTGLASQRTRAFLKIQDGCERRCAYCIIPHARGPSRSKNPSELRKELSALAEAGYREVVLVGINLSCYGQDLGLRLTDALRIACEIPSVARVRLSSLEPELITKDDISVWKRLGKVCPQFHLSLQSGCDLTLARMKRQYDTAAYREIVSGLRDAFPGCALTTDVMVGFPGETDEEYSLSEAFVREIGFARTHVFVYSPRPGTPAAGLPDSVPPETSSRRAKLMAAAARDCRSAYLQSHLGTVEEVLFETRNKAGLWRGYTPSYTPVFVSSDDDIAGSLLPVRLDALIGDGCMGELV